jgi:pimeloyl-ACP methyl ester carboxylesterase
LSRLHCVSDASRKARGAVVFVHGLGGDAFATWRARERDDDFWPAWLAKDLPEFDIWTVEYEASPSTWLGSAMSIPDRAANLLAWFETERLHERPLVFVGHSLGGLVIKQFLRLCADRPGTAMGRLVAATQGVVLLATPNTGSDLASWMDRLRVVLGASSAIKDLQSESPYLRELNGWYRERIPREDIATLVFAETRPTKGLMVVEQTSADPGIPGVLPVPVDADHLSIVKPSDRGELVYKRVRQFIEEQIPSPAKSFVAMEPNKGRRRFFISYRRRARDDAMVAERLYDELTNAGHEVFIDVQMTIGTEWGRQIESRIDWCDFLVVLLSAESIQSEMVQEEVRLAHQRRKRDGTPFILPIRIRYEGPLGYAIGAYIERYQYALWTGEQDTAAVVAQVLKAPEGTLGGLRNRTMLQVHQQEVPAQMA